jgi:hypothetical protein
MRRAGLGIACLLALATGALAAGPEAGTPPLGLNLAGVVDYSTEMPFVDLFRRARAWVSQEEGQPWGKGPALALTPEGWVASLRPKQYATTVLSGGAHPAGRYLCLYDGKGALRFWNAAKAVKEAPGRVELDVRSGPDAAIFLDIRETDPADPVRNIRVLMPGVTDARAKSDPFYAPFLERTRRFGVLRFMDWMDTNDSQVRTWADRPKPTDASWGVKGVPVEVMVDLANRAGADPWFCIPHLADDDYVRQFARLVKATLDPKRKAYLEHSNEVWNGQFAQARHAGDRGLALKLSENRYQAQLYYHSRRSVEIFRLWEEVFGGTGRLVRVLAAQAGNPWTGLQVVTFEDAYRHADALAVAPYFGNELGDPATADATAALPLAEVLARCRQSIERNAGAVAENAKHARERGLDLIAYEAGQHLVGHGGAENNEELTKLLHAANRDPRMEELYRLYLDTWAKNGGGLMAIFSSVSRPSKWGSWGLLEAEDQDPKAAPKWRAVAERLPAPR